MPKDLPATRYVACLLSAGLAGCLWHLGHPHSSNGRNYTMSTEHIEYHQKATQEITAKVAHERERGADEVTVLKVRCEAYDPYIANAPDEPASNFTPARDVLEVDKREACWEYKRAQDEKRAREDSALRYVEQQQRESERLERQRAEAEAERREQQADDERKIRLQAKAITVSGIECTVIDYRTIGDTIGDYISTTATGVYVGVLLKCTNVTKQTALVMARDFALRDGAGRSYAIDLAGSVHYATFLQEEDERSPELLQLHPAMKTYITCVFDVPNELVDDPALKLAFRSARFPLTFDGFLTPTD